MPTVVRRLLPFLICIVCFALFFQSHSATLHAQTPSRTALQAWRDATFLSRIPLSLSSETTALTPAAPDWELSPGQAMVWQQGRGSDWNLWTKYHAGTSIVERLVDFDPAPQLRPRIRPNTDQVAYVLVLSNSETELVTTNLRGGERVNLSNHPGIDDYHTWSKDGKYLYFASTRDGNWELYRMEADGANPVRLTNDPAPNLYPAIAPNGTTLAWISYVSNTRGAIFVQELTTGAVQQITPVLAYPSELMWNATGSELYFSYDGNEDFWFDVGKVNRDGSDLRRLRGAPFWIDFVPGSQYVGDDDLLINRYSYGVENNQLVLQDITIDRLRLPESELEPWLDDSASFVLDIDHQLIDNQPPMVTMTSIPGEWVRAFPSLTLSWSVSDTSIFTATAYDVQQRLNGTTWTSLYTGTTDTTINVSPPAGISIEYRARGVDAVGNIGEWSDPTRAIRGYDYGLDVNLRDNRGLPINHAVLRGAAVVGQQPFGNGTQRAYLNYTNGTAFYPIGFEAEGYSTFPDYSFRIDTGTPAISTFDAYLRGTNELLSNGSFESGNFSGWRTSLTYNNGPIRHTGSFAAELRPNPTQGTARLYRAVNIPAGMYEPTLAFAYNKASHSGIPLQVSVDTGMTETVVFQDGSTPAQAFEMGWVDMTPWAGEVVTVTFSVAPSGSPQLSNNVTVDNVSLTSWATPQLLTVSPAAIPYPYASTVVTVTGENLIAPLTIIINDTEIDATIVDAQTATFILPDTLPPGWHTVGLRNGMGVPATWDGILKLGTSIALPVIYRD